MPSDKQQMRKVIDLCIEKMKAKDPRYQSVDISENEIDGIAGMASGFEPTSVAQFIADQLLPYMEAAAAEHDARRFHAFINSQIGEVVNGMPGLSYGGTIPQSQTSYA